MNILVTGGGTIAPIDDVRQITNLSTGRFSSEISEAALRRGGQVWHLHAQGAQTPFARNARIDLSADLETEFDRVRKLHTEWALHRDRLHLLPISPATVENYSRTLHRTLTTEPIDVVFLAMAVSDFAPVPDEGKLSSDADELVLHCRRLPKVIRSVRGWRPPVYLVGFKLLSGASESELIARAARSGELNGADLTIGNDVRQLRAGQHTIQLVRPGKPVETIGPGGDLAGPLLDRVWSWVLER